MQNGSAFLVLTGRVFRDEMKGQARILTVIVSRPKKGADGRWTSPGSFYDILVWSGADKPPLAPKTEITIVADVTRESEGEHKGRWNLKADASSIRILGYPPRDGESAPAADDDPPF